MDPANVTTERRICPRCGLIYDQVQATAEYAFDVMHDVCPRCNGLDLNRTTENEDE